MGLPWRIILIDLPLPFYISYNELRWFLMKSWPKWQWSTCPRWSYLCQTARTWASSAPALRFECSVASSPIPPCLGLRSFQTPAHWIAKVRSNGSSKLLGEHANKGYLYNNGMLLFQKNMSLWYFCTFQKTWTPNEMDVTCGSKNLPNDHPFPIFLPLLFREPMSTHFRHDFLTMLTYKNRINLRGAVALIHEFLPPRFLRRACGWQHKGSPLNWKWRNKKTVPYMRRTH